MWRFSHKPKGRHDEPWWRSSPWDFVIIATCFAVQLSIAILFLDMNDWLLRIALAALAVYCFWLLGKAVEEWREARQSRREAGDSLT